MKTALRFVFVAALIVIPFAGCGERGASKAPEGAGLKTADPSAIEGAAKVADDPEAASKP